MRFGLIGYGAWGKYHAAALDKTPGATLAAICCKSEASAREAGNQYQNIPIYREYSELLSNPDIDAVDIVLPNHLHAPVGISALNSGKDVLLEKPMATSTEECTQLIAAARANDRVLSIGHEKRLSSQWETIKRLVDAGEIGKPLYAKVSLFRNPYRQGSENWRWRRDTVGSWILEEPVHFFDFILWYFEPWGDPISVLAYGNSKGQDPYLYDNFTSILRFENGAYAIVSQTLCGFEHHLNVEISGEEGAIRSWWSGALDRTFEPTFELKVQRRGQTTCETVELKTGSGEVFELEEELKRTVAAFRERRPLVSGEEGKKRVSVCMAAEQSVRESREIKLDFSN